MSTEPYQLSQLSDNAMNVNGSWTATATSKPDGTGKQLKGTPRHISGTISGAMFLTWRFYV